MVDLVEDHGRSQENVRCLSDLNVPATVIGYFFEVLLARELELLCPDEWRGGASKDEKDLVYVPDPSLSIEVKTSGQLGYRIYGNRSYGQTAANDTLVKKEKSGYYLTVIFVGRALTLIRFGWIDADDWKPQAAPTGQMAGLSDAVYTSKLIPIAGEYRASAPIELLHGVGASTASEFHRCGITTIGDLLATSRGIAEETCSHRQTQCRAARRLCAVVRITDTFARAATIECVARPTCSSLD